MSSTDGCHQPTWVSLHVHRLGDQDRLLVDGLAPRLARGREDRTVRRAFFLRYWQGGHHLRVRIQTDARHADELAARVRDALREYLHSHPDPVTFDAVAFDAEAQPTMAALEQVAVEALQPPDTIRRVGYQPEYGKYGGAAGVAAAEEFFDRSTTLAVAALAHLPSGSANSGRRLGIAFAMMVRGLQALAFTPGRMREFFGHYSLLWSPYVFNEFLDRWPTLLQQRSPALTDFVRSAETSRSSATVPPDRYGAALRTAWMALDERVVSQVTLAGVGATADQRRRAVLASYLHTHNNRLGLTPEQEAFLGYLGHQVLGRATGLAPVDLLDDLRSHRAVRLGLTRREGARSWI